MWQAILHYVLNNVIELLGFVFTTASIWLSTKQNPWGWFFGILSIACYIYISLSAWFLGYFLLNIYFLLTSIYGWYLWRFGKKEKGIFLVTRTSAREGAILVAVGVVCAVLLGGLFSSYKATVPYWDAETTAFSLIGQWLLARKKIENWWVWIFVNVQYIVIFFYKDLIITSLLYLILTILAFKGYKEWYKSLEKN